MSGSRVADGVGPDAFLPKFWVFRSEFANVPGDDVMDAKPSQRLSVAAEEHSLVIRLAARELFQFARGGGPQRAEANFVSLAVKLDKRSRYFAGTPSEIANCQPSRLAGACS